MAYFKGKKTITVNLNTDVIANPELTGDEAELTGLQVSNVKYAITQVEANPTLAGTEADLTGLQIGDTKYAIPSGGGGSGKYQHNVYMRDQNFTIDINFSFIDSSPTPYTTEAGIANTLYNMGFIAQAPMISANGVATYSGTKYVLYEIYASSATSLFWRGAPAANFANITGAAFTNTWAKLEDIVIAL